MPNLAILGLLALNIGPVTPGTPCRQPQLAASRPFAALTFGCGDAVYFATSRDEGHTWSAPVKVATADKLALGRHRGPRIAVSRGAIVISAITGGPAEGNLVSWRSTDGARTWSPAVRVNDVPRAAREGLHAMAAGRNGTVVAVWLDMRGNGTKLYGSRSTDGGATWSPNSLVYESPDGTICQCCHPGVQVADDGGVWVMWRNALAGNRDMYVAHSEDGRVFGGARKVGEGSWELKACPMDGGGLALRDGRPWTAWRREKTIYLAEPGAAERAIGEGKDVAMAAGSRGLYAAWSNGPAIEVHLPGRSGPEKLAAHGAYPALVALPNGSVLAAWESEGSIGTEVLE